MHIVAFYLKCLVQLTLTVLWGTSADDKVMKFFYFPRK